MPIRDRLDLFHRFDYFRNLTPEEKQALNEFNQAFDRFLDTAVHNYKKLKAEKNPHQQPILSPNDIARIKNLALKRLESQGYHTIPIPTDGHLGSITQDGLIRLALHPNGKHFYQYLNDVVSAEIHKRTNNNEYEVTDDLHAHLNGLSTAEFQERLEHSTPSDNIFYTRIEGLCGPLKLENWELLCMDGKAIDCLCSMLLFAILGDNNIKYRLSMQSLTPELKQEVLAHAAQHGSYNAAHTLIEDYARAIRNCPTVESSLELYLRCEEYLYTHIIPQYQTAGYLLLVELLQSLRCSNDRLYRDEERKTEFKGRDEVIAIKIYHTLTEASRKEHTCKNILRLGFASDNSQQRLAQLVSTYKLTRQSLELVDYSFILIYYRERYPRLISLFEQPPITPTFAKGVQSHLPSSQNFSFDPSKGSPPRQG